MNDNHELRVQNDGEADAVCSCGGWRLLRVSTTMAPQPGRLKDIQDAFDAHLDKVGGTTVSKVASSE